MLLRNRRPSSSLKRALYFVPAAGRRFPFANGFCSFCRTGINMSTCALTARPLSGLKWNMRNGIFRFWSELFPAIFFLTFPRARIRITYFGPQESRNPSYGIRDEGVEGHPCDERITLSEGSRKKMKFSLNRLPMQIRVPNFMHTSWVSALLLLLRTPGAHSLFS